MAHGIASTVDEERVLIGSAHFVFEDEKCVIPEGEQEKFDALPPEYSQLYLAIDGVLSAVLCISDPLREEAKDVLTALRGLGVRNAVMLTGDSPRTAAAIAAQLLIDRFHVTAIINAGTAGGMDPLAALFDTVVTTQTAYHDMTDDILTEFHPWLPDIYFRSDAALLSAAKRAAEKRQQKNHCIYAVKAFTMVFFMDTAHFSYNMAAGSLPLLFCKIL